MSQGIINWISALAGLVAAGGGLWAARAAHQSAVTAQEAARHAESVERRAVLRDLVATAHSVIAESIRINALVEEVKTEILKLSRGTQVMW
jgi:replicative DNA helicase